MERDESSVEAELMAGARQQILASGSTLGKRAQAGGVVGNDGIDLTLHHREIYALLAKNGPGKPG